MNALQILGLVLFIVALAGVLGYMFQSGNSEEEFTFTTPEYTKEELENIKAAEAEYNKPIVVEELTVKEPEFVKPEIVEKVVETSKVFPADAQINLEAETPKPAKKKRKYYPKKAK